MPGTIRIGLLDNDQDVRSGRKLLFSSLPNTEVVFDSDGTMADLEPIQASLIDVLVIDQKLTFGSGIDFYSSLRDLVGVKQAPPAILTASFTQPDLLFQALSVGVIDVVAIEQGAERLVDAIQKARSFLDVYSLAAIREMVSSQPRIRQVDLNFVSLVDQLPEKLASNLRRLKGLWQKEDMTKLEQYDFNSMKEIVSRLPVVSATELLLALEKSGLLDD